MQEHLMVNQMLCKNIYKLLCDVINEEGEQQSHVLVDAVTLSKDDAFVELSLYFWEQLTPEQIALYEAQEFKSKEDYVAFFATHCPELYDMIHRHFSRAEQLKLFINMHNQFITIHVTAVYRLEQNLVQLHKRIMKWANAFMVEYKRLKRTQTEKPLND